ncbi:unnamed protein product [Allacma fusca]|uniref:Rap-GAP domain-containing protein n=1 Tax=Allacma fusca TaxID=39272 RepID=A0A8J2PUJ4_9HEXA|nr:unnamed protein product [Allacma fusca]
MSKDKSFPDKLKNFFKGLNKGVHVPRSRSEEYVILTEELENDLKADSPVATRLKAIKEINEVAKHRRFESFATEKLWSLLQDLLKADVPRDTRHIVMSLFTSLCQTQVEKNGYLRAEFFLFIKNHNLEEDAVQKFAFLKALTDNGRDVSYFEEKLGPLILAWMGGSHSIKKTGEFMIFLNNFLKFNQSFVDQEILASIVQNVCFVACTTAVRQDTLECIHVLETVISYGSSLPTNSLSTFLATLCRTVNIEFLCQASWKTVRNLLGTHLGHSGLLTMCKFMETADRTEDFAVIRGAVFFVGVSLWGTKLVRTLKYTPSTVLSSFAAALELLEIIGAVVEDTQGGEWKNDAINHNKIVRVINETLDLIEAIVDSGSFSGALHLFYNVIEAATSFRSESSIEKLMNYKQKNFLYCTKANWLNHLILFSERNFREEYRPSLKVKAVKIIHQVAISQLQTHEDDLIDKIILQYFKALDSEMSIHVRQAGVDFIVEFLLESTSKKCYEVVGILERIVNRPYESMSSSGTLSSHEMLHESDAIDIITAISGLIQLFQKKIYFLPSSIPIYCYRILVRHLSYHYKRINVLDHCGTIRYNIFNCFFKIRANSIYHLGFPREEIDHSTNSFGGIRYSPYLAVDHRDGERPDVSKSDHGETTTSHSNSSSSSSSSFNNSNSTNIIAGSQTAGGICGPQTLTTPVVTSISLTLACKLVVTCLRKEKDWKILELVLKQIPHVLENKALVLSKHGNDIDYLATALCAMVTDKSASSMEILRNAPTKFSRSEFQGYIFPILTSLVSYHTHLEPSVQLKIVKCLELGLVTKCTRICILSLSICSLEMKDTMHKLLPEVLLSLSKITPRINIAIPVLEFLSTLIHLPRIFASFVQDQYMAIFAIALPYTNPFKFNQYTVSLAHHVIAMWFLKCRLSFRRGFVSFIIKGLEANVWAPFEEASQKRGDLHNEDSSNRKRSSSLTDQTFKRRERPISGHHIPGGGGPLALLNNPASRYANPPVLDWKLPMDKSLMSFHQELTETCVDLMARYTFADCSALPTRFQSTNFLLNSGGHSQTWLSDNKIITITTSGCTQKELRDGLCDKCWLLCRKFLGGSDSLNNSREKFDLETPPTLSTQKNLVGMSENASLQRRRHRSAFAGSTCQGGKSRPDSLLDHGIFSLESKIKTRDDLHLDDKMADLDDGMFPSAATTHEITLKPKSEHSLCTCWCQGWAEVHIRRPTGNTSWMMRVQNQLGNHTGFEFPIKELSALYMNTMFTLKSVPTSGEGSSTHSSPGHKANPFLSNPQQANNNVSNGSQFASNNVSQQAINNGLENNKDFQINSTPPSPLSPNCAGSPIEEYCSESGRKNPVRRSNSSPEMCSSWKAPFMNQQREIEEQDEEDLGGALVSSQGPTTRTVPVAVTSNGNHATSNFVPTNSTEVTDLDAKIKLLGSSGAPFQTYDTIPEEISHVMLPDKSALEDLTPIRRDRMSTISVMTPARRPGTNLRRMLSSDSSIGRNSSGSSGSGETGIRSGISPGFIFLQLCAQGMFGGNKPLHLPMSEPTKKSLKVLDYIQPYETHKIGVVYVGLGQVTNETQILQNQYGSSRYREFLNGLGKLIKLSQVDPQKTFLGGLSRDGNDGDFATIWQDDVMQVIFHVATLMPNVLATDPSCNAKKRHIGNDFVAIVYNNSGEEYDISTIKCQFLYACVVIEPLDHKTNRVIVKAKPILSDLIGHTEPKIVSDQNLPILARQWALHSNLASVIFQSMQRPGADPYASNWLERLRHIKRLRNRMSQELTGHQHNNPEDSANATATSPALGSGARKSFNVDDFTEFVSFVTHPAYTDLQRQVPQSIFGTPISFTPNKSGFTKHIKRPCQKVTCLKARPSILLHARPVKHVKMVISESLPKHGTSTLTRKHY